jgi:flagellar basal-body rod protein FlgC
MNMQGAFRGLELAVSGLAAEQKRMNVIMENVANVGVTRVDPQDPNSGPYIRRRVYFSEVMDRHLSAGGGGIQAGEPVQDRSGEFPRVHDPGHADADAEGFVTHSNVNLIYEMLDLTSAKGAFQANLATFKNWRDIVNESIQLMRT